MAAALALVVVTLLATPQITLAAPASSHCVCNITASYVCTTADLIANPQDSTATCENTLSADGTLNANIMVRVIFGRREDECSRAIPGEDVFRALPLTPRPNIV